METDDSFDPEKRDEIFKGFKDDKKKSSYTRFIIPIITVLIVAGLLTYLVSSIFGNKLFITASVINPNDEEAKQALAENEKLLGEIGVNSGGEVTSSAAGEVTSSTSSAGAASQGEYIPATASSTQTTIKSANEAINAILKLRVSSNKKAVVEIAQSITSIGGYINQVNKPDMLNPWQTIIACAYDGCSDKVFVNMVDAIVADNLGDTKSRTMHSLIETYNYWDGRNTVLFSSSLTNTNKLILDNYSTGILAKWNEMISCNGKCENFTNILFEIIELINNY